MTIRFAVFPHHRSWLQVAAPPALAALAVAALLLSLLVVLREAVQRGVTLRRATAEQADQAWRCRSLPQRPVDDQCLRPVAALR